MEAFNVAGIVFSFIAVQWFATSWKYFFSARCFFITAGTSSAKPVEDNSKPKPVYAQRALVIRRFEKTVSIRVFSPALKKLLPNYRDAPDNAAPITWLILPLWLRPRE